MVYLREILKSKNNELYVKFIHIEKISENIMSNFRVFFPDFTNHDFSHLKNVEHNIENIINDVALDHLSDEEIFCLLSAAFLHDIGMIPFDNEKDEFNNKSKEERDKFSNKIRENHHRRSSLYVMDHKNELKINDFEAKAIAKICKGHRIVDLNSFENVYSDNIIKIDLLAAILRLADECDISMDRESSLSSEGINSTIKKNHYRIHSIVKEVKINHIENKIIIVANVLCDNDKEILINSKNKIMYELNNTAPFLEKIGIVLNDVILETNVTSTFLKKQIILCIAKNEDINSLTDEFISNENIDFELDNLIAANMVINNSMDLSEDFDKFKEMFKLFLDNEIDKFFFTNYVQNMIPKCFMYFENNFNVDWGSEDRKYRINILKNSPTAFHFLLFMDDLVKTPNFNCSSNQNGNLMFDSILSFGLFNDIHHYVDKINFDEVDKSFIKFEIFNKEYVLKKINGYKMLR